MVVSIEADKVFPGARRLVDFDDGSIPRLQGSELLHVWGLVEGSDDGKFNVHFPTGFAVPWASYRSEISFLFSLLSPLVHPSKQRAKYFEMASF